MFSTRHIETDTKETSDVQAYEKLVENEDDKNPADGEGFTPLYVAAEKGHLVLFEVISKNCRDKNPGTKVADTPLHIAARNGHYDICKLIVDDVKNKNPKNQDGVTPLFIAANIGRFEIFQLIRCNFGTGVNYVLLQYGFLKQISGTKGKNTSE